MPSSWRTSTSKTGPFPRTESLLQKRKPRFSGDCSVHQNHVCLCSCTSKQPLGCCKFFMVGETSRSHWMNWERQKHRDDIPGDIPQPATGRKVSETMVTPLLCHHNIPLHWCNFTPKGCCHAEKGAPSAACNVSGNTHKTLTPAVTSVRCQLHENLGM